MNMYGSAEAGNNAFECPEGSLHMTVEATWLQLRAPGAREGEAVATDMFLRGFPMIRYAVGDEVVLRPGRCPCNRHHPMLASVEGRSGEPIVLPNGRRINPNLPSYVFKPLSESGVFRRYRFVLTADGRLTLYLVVSRTFREKHLELVEREVKSAFGDDIQLDIEIVDTLPHLPNAKHRDFVSVGRS